MELFDTIENRLPPGSVCREVAAADGVVLRGMTAGVGSDRGTVLLLNGRADFLERYFETMRDLVARGFWVASFDWRGQGGSTRQLEDRIRGHVHNFRSYDEDLKAAMEQLVRPHCPGPYYALAHSTGGHILLRNISTETWFSKAIITAPLMELNYGPWPRWLARFLAYFFVQASLSWLFLPTIRRKPMTRDDFPGNPLTSDEDRWGRDMLTLEKHPELGVGGPTFGWLNAAIASIRSLKRLTLPEGLKCPVLMVLAGRDRVVDNTAAQEFAKRIPGVSLVVIQDALHEILIERDVLRAEFFAALDAYFDTGSDR